MWLSGCYLLLKLISTHNLWDKYFVGGRNTSQEISRAPQREARIRRSLPLPQLWEAAREQLRGSSLAGENEDCQLRKNICEKFWTKVCLCVFMRVRIMCVK